MSKIFGDPQVIKQAESAKSDDKSVHINWEAIRDIPDEYEVVISSVEFDPKNIKDSFSDVGNNTYMPKPELSYKIAEARGIIGLDKKEIEPIYEDINFSEQTRQETPNIIKILTGYRVTKQSAVLEEDGTTRVSSPCTIDYNAWNRCCELWAKEEMYTEGYSKKGKFPNKYESPYQRKSHFFNELKFAMQKAETKAYTKTIRELAGMATGYKLPDLASGRFIFAKVRRSRSVLQMETAARLAALSTGNNQESAQKQLFGPSETVHTPEIEVVSEPSDEPIDISNMPEVNNHREDMINAITFYQNEDVIDDQKLKSTADNLLNWIKGEKSPESNEKFWNKAIATLKEIEKNIPKEFKFKHNLYIM